LNFEFSPIAYIRTPFHTKFAVPRQPNLAPLSWGIIEFRESLCDPAYVRELETASHLWLQFVFHEVGNRPDQPTVRPPRLGGNKRIGVFATRSTHRPNALGLSVVKLEAVLFSKGQLAVRVSGVDLVDGTPILDIKPYVPYSDRLPEASYGIAQTPPASIAVEFMPQALSQLQLLAPTQHSEKQQFIHQVLSQDPRPAYAKEDSDRIYGVELWDLEVKFKIDGQCLSIIECLPRKP